MKLNTLHLAILDVLDRSAAPQSSATISSSLNQPATAVNAALDQLVIDDRILCHHVNCLPAHYTIVGGAKKLTASAPAPVPPAPSAPASQVATAAPRPRRAGRRTAEEIDAAIVDALESRPMRVSELQTQLDVKGCAVMARALDRLSGAGRIRKAEGRYGAWSLAGASNTPLAGASNTPLAAFVAEKRQTAAAKRPAIKHTPLDLELAQLSERFAPVHRMPEKIAVLDRLSSSIAGSVGTILIEIRADLVRIGGAS